MRSTEKIRHNVAIHEDGATLVLIAIVLVMLIAFAALALDVGHLYVVRNELHNAADAGALAGARRLLNSDGSVFFGANDIAHTAAEANRADRVAVEVNWTNGQNNDSDVERGHWSFQTQTFTANPNDQMALWWQIPSATLDLDVNFINAVRVKARRENPQADSFFARILGFIGFDVYAEAVAYIGFAGKLNPEEVDLPIAICREAVVDADGKYSCSLGRMVTNSQDSETAAWTDFSQEPCSGGANSNSIIPCAGNGSPLVFGNNIGVINGEDQADFKQFWDCWWANSAGGTKPWRVMLPVIECAPGSGKVPPCTRLVGAVAIDIIWVNQNGFSNLSKLDDAPSNDPNASPGGAPLSMEGFGKIGSQGRYENWVATSTNGLARWEQFKSWFNLQVSTKDYGWTQKTVYFVPDCDLHEPTGVSGGENFGILAEIPVLVH